MRSIRLPTAYLREIIPRDQFILCRSNYELLKELMREVKEGKFIVCLDDFEKLKDKDLIKKFLLLGLTVVLITDEEENLLLLAEDVEKAREEVKEIRRKYTLEKLGEHYKLIYEIIKMNPGIASGKLNQAYRKACREAGLESKSQRM